MSTQAEFPDLGHRKWPPVPAFSPTITLAPDPHKAAVMASRVGLAEGDVFTLDGVRYHVDAVEPADDPGASRHTYRVSAL